MPSDWTLQNLGRLDGKTVLVTGANSGIGFHTALELGRAGARVLVACRDPERGQAAVDQLRAGAASATFQLESLDLAELSSVRALAERIDQQGQVIDILINNAGVMALPERQRTGEGFERQF